MKKTLIDRLKDLDESAYEDLYKIYFKSSTSVLDRRIDMDMRKDIFQEVLYSLFSRIKQDDSLEVTNLGSWLKRACINQANNRIKKEMNIVPIQYEQDGGTSEIDYIDDRNIRLRKALDEIGEGCRELLMMFYHKGFDYDELTGIMDLSRDYIKNKKARCIKKIKSIMN